jgi:hypothetical protein
MEQKTSTSLTLPQRAAVALGSGEHESKLRDLVKSSADIVEVKNVDGREQAHRIGMTLKNARIAIEKAGKAAREDAIAFSKAIIAEQDRLVAIVDPEETRIFGLRDAFDAAEEAKRQAAIKAERERVDNIQAALSAMCNEVLNQTGKSSEWLKTRYEAIFAERITEDFYQEFTDEAKAVRSDMLGKFSDLICQTAAHELAVAQDKAEREAEAARLKAEREELEHLRAEAKRQADENHRKAEEARKLSEAKLAEQRAAQEQELAAQRAEIARQQAELAEALRAKEAAEQAERDLIAQEAAAREAQERRQQLQAAVREHLQKVAKSGSIELCWSTNEETFDCDSLEEVLDSNDGLEVGSVVYFGEKKNVDASDLFFSDWVIDGMSEQAYEMVGEVAENYPNVSKEAREDLNALVEGWINKHCQPNFWQVLNVKKYEITEEDLARVT